MLTGVMKIRNDTAYNADYRGRAMGANEYLQEFGVIQPNG